MGPDLAGKVGGVRVRVPIVHAHCVADAGVRPEFDRRGEVARIERGLVLHAVHVVAARPRKLYRLPVHDVHRPARRGAAEPRRPPDRRRRRRRRHRPATRGICDVRFAAFPLLLPLVVGPSHRALQIQRAAGHAAIRFPRNSTAGTVAPVRVERVDRGRCDHRHHVDTNAHHIEAIFLIVRGLEILEALLHRGRRRMAGSRNTLERCGLVEEWGGNGWRGVGERLIQRSDLV